jgi:hypothetical protein
MRPMVPMNRKGRRGSAELSPFDFARLGTSPPYRSWSLVMVQAKESHGSVTGGGRESIHLRLARMAR